MKKNLLFLLLILTLLGCQDKENEPITIVVTQIVTVEGAAQIITKIVTPTPDPNQTNATQTKPVILDLGMNINSITLDPQSANSENNLDLIENLFVGLTNHNSLTNQIEPELAERWEVDSSALIWTFHLRSDIQWISAQTAATSFNKNESIRPVRPVTASDVVYSIHRACNPETNLPDVFILFIIQGCEEVHQARNPTAEQFNSIGAYAIDDTTLEIRLKSPTVHFLAISSMWLIRPLPQELIEEKGEEWAIPANIMINGPFLINNNLSIPQQRTVLQKNPLWPIPFKGNVTQVNISHNLNSEELYGMWENQMIDLSPLPVIARAKVLADIPQRVQLIPSQSVFYLSYNFDSPIFREANVRRAFGAAIDRERLIREVYGGQGLPMRHFAPPGIEGAPPIDEVGTGYSPDYARQQMADSPFVHCRLMPPITYLINSSDQALQEAELLREMWVTELGCREEQIIIEQTQFGALLARTRRDNPNERPDLWNLGWASYYPDESNWVGDVLHCEESENRQNRRCESVDDLIQLAKQTVSQTERRTLYRQIENLLFANNGLEPITPLYVRSRYLLIQNWVTAYYPSYFGGEQFDTISIDARIKELERDR